MKKSQKEKNGVKHCDHNGDTVSPMNYEIHLKHFVSDCQKIVNESMKQYHWDSKLSIHSGRRYDKIMAKDVADNTNSPHNRSIGRIWAFVDRTNGDILKPASWKGPAYMDTIKEYYGA